MIPSKLLLLTLTPTTAIKVFTKTDAVSTDSEIYDVEQNSVLSREELFEGAEAAPASQNLLFGTGGEQFEVENLDFLQDLNLEKVESGDDLGSGWGSDAEVN